jgi:tRNA nucleotidyltransferase (CCA-adding enzyme)
MKISSGILFWRLNNKNLEVLLVHPSGDYNKDAKWGIPKGIVEKYESIIQAAIREVKEEIGINTEEDDLEYFGYCVYKNKKKRVECFLSRAKFNELDLIFNWEIDKAKFFSFKDAIQIIHPDQKVFIENLKKICSGK